MTRIAPLVSLLICLSVSCLSDAADQPLIVDLWPGKVPGDVGISGEEKFRELIVDGKSYEVGGKPTRWLTNRYQADTHGLSAGEEQGPRHGLADLSGRRLP